MTFEIEKHDYSEVYSQFQNVIRNYIASAKNGHLNLQESNFSNRDIGNVKVLSVDVNKKRISLTIKGCDKAPEENN